MPEFISEVFVDDLTGLTFAEDIRGFYYLLPSDTPVSVSEFYLHAMIIDPTWANTTSFQSLPTPLTSTKIVDSYIKFVLASQDFKNAYGTSLLGLFLDGALELAIPFNKELNYALDSPLLVPANVELEIKFWPFNKKANLGITVGMHE